MKEAIIKLFGEGKDLEWWQMTDRAVIIFFLTLILLRISGRRSFGMKSPFDNTITILLGAVLSRAVTGASPFLPAVAASAALVILHRVFAWAAIRSHKVGAFLKGEPTVLYEHGKINAGNMQKSLISQHDLMEGVRSAANESSLEDIEKAVLERNGVISVVRKKQS